MKLFRLEAGLQTATSITSPEARDNPPLSEFRVYAEPQTDHRTALVFGFMKLFRLKAGL
ncbi:MAG: hypothetical protein QHJ82_10735 [Verrucomicrobiota bacterium]|nr:hypothetical protein [Verrucomicrobiota bacterium]